MSLRNQTWDQGSAVCFFRNSQHGRIKAGHRWTAVACRCVYKNHLIESNKNAIAIILNQGRIKEEKYMGKLFNSKIRERGKMYIPAVASKIKWRRWIRALLLERNHEREKNFAEGRRFRILFQRKSRARILVHLRKSDNRMQGRSILRHYWEEYKLIRWRGRRRMVRALAPLTFSS